MTQKYKINLRTNKKIILKFKKAKITINKTNKTNKANNKMNRTMI